MIVLYLGLVCWLVTTIVVESEITRPLRGYVSRKLSIAADPFSLQPPWKVTAWSRLSYLLGCHLCTGTWIGLLLALFIPGGPFVWFINGLLYKAVGHFVLEVVGVLKKVSA